MVMLADGENSYNCQEGSRFPSADNYLYFPDNIVTCQEGAEMRKGTHHSKDTIYKLSDLNKHRPSPTVFKKGHTTSIVIRKKISEANKGKPAWNKGLPLSHSQIEKMIAQGKTLVGKNNPFYGRKHTLITKERWSKKRKGRKHSKEELLKIHNALKGKYCGEKSWNWKGGSSFEPYCPKFNNQLKERIRDRDDRTCQLCGVKENGQKLSVHHIHYDKPNCNPDLISLCHVCHTKVNHNREHWEQYFTDLLLKRGLFWQ